LAIDENPTCKTAARIRQLTRVNKQDRREDIATPGYRAA